MLCYYYTQYQECQNALNILLAHKISTNQVSKTTLQKIHCELYVLFMLNELAFNRIRIRDKEMYLFSYINYSQLKKIGRKSLSHA